MLEFFNDPVNVGTLAFGLTCLLVGVAILIAEDYISESNRKWGENK